MTPNDVLEWKRREKALKDAEDAISPAERRAKFPNEVKARLDAIRDAVAKLINEPLAVSFTDGMPHDADGGHGVASLRFALCYGERQYGTGCINVVDNGKVEFYDRTAAHHEPAVHLTFAELTEDAVIEFLARVTSRHLKI